MGQMNWECLNDRMVENFLIVIIVIIDKQNFHQGINCSTNQVSKVGQLLRTQYAWNFLFHSKNKN